MKPTKKSSTHKGTWFPKILLSILGIIFSSIIFVCLYVGSLKAATTSVVIFIFAGFIICFLLSAFNPKHWHFWGIPLIIPMVLFGFLFGLSLSGATTDLSKEIFLFESSGFFVLLGCLAGEYLGMVVQTKKVNNEREKIEEELKKIEGVLLVNHPEMGKVFLWLRKNEGHRMKCTRYTLHHPTEAENTEATLSNATISSFSNFSVKEPVIKWMLVDYQGSLGSFSGIAMPCEKLSSTRQFLISNDNLIYTEGLHKESESETMPENESEVNLWNVLELAPID
jgi:hypothetical protein